ncbi:MAG TPA: tetratricopeptide repeat protein, partial [Thermoanaerobaculia bacterium]
MLRSAALGLLLLGAGALVGCATSTPAVTSQAADTPRRPLSARERDAAAEAYYHYSVAQMQAQGGRFKEAIEPMREALRLDPDSAFLWSALAQWLARADQPVEAIEAARRAVQLAPSTIQPHLTLADLLRSQKKYAEAEAELERVIALTPDSEEAYLTLARYQVEQKSFD